MILDLVKRTDPVLYKQTDPIDFSSPQIDPEKLYYDLRETMIHLGGLGLSANQVGIPYSCFVMGDPKDPDGILGIFNPTVLHLDEKEVYKEEGCLTFPNMLIKIKRPDSVRFRASNFEGKTDSNKFTGLSARIFLHEYDHLQGIIFTKRANLYYLEKAKKQYARHTK